MIQCQEQKEILQNLTQAKRTIAKYFETNSDVFHNFFFFLLGGFQLDLMPSKFFYYSFNFLLQKISHKESIETDQPRSIYDSRPF